MYNLGGAGGQRKAGDKKMPVPGGNGGNMIKGFKMKLFEGQEAEYERRHNLLWPEMKDMIHEHGGKNYSIFLDKETMVLYGYIEIEDEELWAKGADTPSIENGGTLWLTLWKQILITVLFQKIYTLYSIWIDKMCIN